MNEENTGEEFEFDEIIEERDRTRIEFVGQFHEIPVCSNSIFVLPFMDMTLHVRDEKLKAAAAYCEKYEIPLGLVTETKDGGLPPAGTVGVACEVVGIDRKTLGETHLVEVHGYIRFTIDEYLESEGEPYKRARITFFEDDEPTIEERKMLPEIGNEFRRLMREYARLMPKKKRLLRTVEQMGDEGLYIYSFYFWELLKPLPQEIRQVLIELRSYVKRTYCFNEELERVVEKAKKRIPATFN